MPAGEAMRRVVILGSGPNRIGQGIEFDYCSVPRRPDVTLWLGYEAVMVNSTPATVSTDSTRATDSTSSRFTPEEVLAVLDRERRR